MENIWLTEIRILTEEGETVFAGPEIIGYETQKEAQDYCDENGLAFCFVVGRKYSLTDSEEIDYSSNIG